MNTNQTKAVCDTISFLSILDSAPSVEVIMDTLNRHIAMLNDAGLTDVAEHLKIVVDNYIDAYYL